MSAHPNAELLIVCRQLAEMKAKWERLYDGNLQFKPLTIPKGHG